MLGCLVKSKPKFEPIVNDVGGHSKHHPASALWCARSGGIC